MIAPDFETRGDRFEECGGTGLATWPWAQSAKADFVQFQRRVFNPSSYPTRRLIQPVDYAAIALSISAS